MDVSGRCHRKQHGAQNNDGRYCINEQPEKKKKRGDHQRGGNGSKLQIGHHTDHESWHVIKGQHPPEYRCRTYRKQRYRSEATGFVQYTRGIFYFNRSVDKHTEKVRVKRRNYSALGRRYYASNDTANDKNRSQQGQPCPLKGCPEFCEGRLAGSWIAIHNGIAIDCAHQRNGNHEPGDRASQKKRTD